MVIISLFNYDEHHRSTRASGVESCRAGISVTRSFKIIVRTTLRLLVEY